MVKPLIRISLIESDIMLELLKKWHIEADRINLNILSKRIVYIITKYVNLKWLFNIIYNNYKDFKKYHNDIEIGSEQFNEIILRKINKGKVVIASERFNTEFKTLVNNLKKDRTPTYEFILNNLPLDSLNEINTSNDNKVNLFFQKTLAKEMISYLNLTKMSITHKQLLLGYTIGTEHMEVNIRSMLTLEKRLFWIAAILHPVLMTE